MSSGVGVEDVQVQIFEKVFFSHQLNLHGWSHGLNIALPNDHTIDVKRA